MRIRNFVTGVAMATGLGWVGPMPDAHADEGMTLAALRIAYQREIASQQQYSAFAERAEQDGYLGVRDLFDALSQCEGIHARLQAFQLTQMDAVPVPARVLVLVDSTRENLWRAFLDEMNERRSVYKKFTDCARAENLYDVLAAFRYTSDAEATHARMISLAYTNLARMTDAHVYFICPACGCIRGETASRRCLCGESGTKFVAVGGGPPTLVPKRLLATR